MKIVIKIILKALLLLMITFPALGKDFSLLPTGVPGIIQVMGNPVGIETNHFDGNRCKIQYSLRHLNPIKLNFNEAIMIEVIGDLDIIILCKGDAGIIISRINVSSDGAKVTTLKDFYRTVRKLPTYSYIGLHVQGENLDGIFVNKFALMQLGVNGPDGKERLEKQLGLELYKEDDKILVDTVLFKSVAQQSGIDFDWEIQRVFVFSP